MKLDQLEARDEAIAQADAHVSNVGLPTYRELADIIRSMHKAGLLDADRLGNNSMHVARSKARKALVVIDNQLEHHTMRYTASNSDGMELTVRMVPEQDLDKRARAWDEEAEEFVWLNGWMWKFTLIEAKV